MILGIDEVGRGPWAGPMVVGAVILTGPIDGLDDSKKLTQKRREQLDGIIRSQSPAYGLGWVSPAEIDELGLGQALRLACRRAVAEVDKAHVPYDEIVIDGTVNLLAGTTKAPYVTTLKKADSLIAAVSAASIVAKVARDNYMTEQSLVYPDYGFDHNAGYGTAEHVAAIDRVGVTPLHRLSFAPLAKYRAVEPATVGVVSKLVQKLQHIKPKPEALEPETTRQVGDKSETAAALELKRLGHEILERNWRTKYCEIDIVSRHGETLCFTEVKHRRTSRAGSGLEAITAKKLHQMEFAAKMYVHLNKISGQKLQLLAVATIDDQPKITDVVEII